VKLKPYEIAGSAVAAVVAAGAASVFGVKGTVVGAAIGASVATLVASLFSQSAARAQAAMRRPAATGSPKVAVGAPGPAWPGAAAEPGDGAGRLTPWPGDAGARSRPTAVAHGDPEAKLVGDGALTVAPGDPALGRRSIVAAGSGWWTPRRRLRGRTGSTSRRTTAVLRPRPLSAIILTTALVAFTIALGAVTLFEVGVGRSLTSLLGGPRSGTTVGAVINGVAATTTTTTSPTATTSPSATTPATTSPSSATTATTTTTSTVPSTTTTVAPVTSTTATAPGTTTSSP
jgi:cell division septation protein DedD